jgi:Zn-finger nucleic acid-binding protein
MLDHCSECQGVWFDAQELGKLSNEVNLGGKLKVLRKLEKRHRQ